MLPPRPDRRRARSVLLLSVLAVSAGPVVLVACSAEEATPASSSGPSPSLETPRGAPLEIFEGGDFADVTASSGVDFRYASGATGELHMPEVIGGGVGLLDADGDGALDVYLVNGGADPVSPAARGSVVNALYRNAGDLHFEPVANAGGAPGGTYGMGVTIGDANGDGLDDLYVTNLGTDDLYLARGEGEGPLFERADTVVAEGWSCSAAFLDHDADGDLDLFVARYVVFDPDIDCFDSADRPEYCGPKTYAPTSDVLLVGDGRGGLTDGSAEAGIAGTEAAGLGVATGDFDEDGIVDVYVANDAYANNLWVGQGDGTFVDDALLLGSAYNLHGQAEAGMGVVAVDFDDDTRLDLFMTHLVRETNTYYRNLGEGRGFVDATGKSGLAQTSMAYTGFGIAAFDAELDGDVDLLVANGRVKKGEVLPGTRMPEPWDRYAEPNLYFRNEGQGRFVNDPVSLAAVCAPHEITRSIAAGDLDGDGDDDLVLVNTEGPARVYRNDAEHVLEPLVLDLRTGGRTALGAVVDLQLGEGPKRRRVVSGGFGYCSSGDPRIRTGWPAGLETGVAVVRWPTGDSEEFELSGAGEHELEQGEGQALP